MKSLLELILEEIEYEKLIEEGKDPVELLHYKFQNVPSNIIDKVIEIDPTKKKSYSQWLLNHYNDESNVIKDNLDNGRIEQLFQHYKSHNDIQIKDCPSVEEGLRKYVPEVDTVLTKSSKPTTYIENIGEDVSSELANDFDVVFNEDDWLIAVPNTYEAECKLGENTRWCTANEYGNGESYYNRYVSDGPLYVNFDMSKTEVLKGKEYPFTRYQFHFQTHQFCDAQDSVINVNDTNIPESAMQFYESKGYDTEDFEVQCNSMKVKDITLKTLKTLMQKLKGTKSKDGNAYSVFLKIYTLTYNMIASTNLKNLMKTRISICMMKTMTGILLIGLISQTHIYFKMMLS